MNALITGGSSGLGYELSRHFARDGYKLLWVSENNDELDDSARKLKSEFPEVVIHTCCADLSQPSGPDHVLKWSEQFGDVDVLVNNAGFGTFGYFGEIDGEKELQMLHLNVVGFYSLIRAYLPRMEKRGHGKILNTSSNTAFQPVPKMSAYAASKVFVKHFSQSLSRELKAKKSDVTVTVVCPPAIKNTSFMNRAGMNGVRTFNSFLTATAEEIARDAYEGMKKGSELVIAGRSLRRSRCFNKIVPEFIVNKILWNELKKS